MNCKKTTKLMIDRLSGEISVKQNLALTQHLESCERCRSEFAALVKGWNTITNALKNAEAPKKLSAERRAKIQELASNSQPPRWYFLRYAAMVLLVCAVLVILAGMLLPALNSSREKARRIMAASNLGQITKEPEIKEDKSAGKTDTYEWGAGFASVPGQPVQEKSKRSVVGTETISAQNMKVYDVTPAPRRASSINYEQPPSSKSDDGNIAHFGRDTDTVSSRFNERTLAKKQKLELSEGRRAQIRLEPQPMEAPAGADYESPPRSSSKISVPQKPSSSLAMTIRLNLKMWNLTSVPEIKKWLHENGISGVKIIKIDRSGNRLSIEVPKTHLQRFKKIIRGLSAQEQKLKELSGGLPFYPTALRPESTFSINTNTASYTRARQMVLSGRQPDPRQIYAEDFINYFDYHYPSPRNGLFNIITEAAPNPFRRANITLRIGLQGKKLGPTANSVSNYTIVLDASGSMLLGERMNVAVKAIVMLAKRLNPGDRMHLVICRETPVVFWEKSRIIPEIRKLKAYGQADLLAGLKRAYSTARRFQQKNTHDRVVLITDGRHSLSGLEHAEILALVRQGRAEGISNMVLGFGQNGDDELLDAIATNGDGSYVFLDDFDEVEKLFTKHFEARFRPIAGDVKVQVEFNPEAVREYRQIGYDRRQLSSEDFRDDKINAGEVGSGQAVTALYELRINPEAVPDTIVAAVRLRYRNLETVRIEEREFHLTIADLKKSWNVATPQFQLAVLVAEFAETLAYPEVPGIANPRGILNQLQILQRNPGGLAKQLTELADFLKRYRQ